MPDKEKGLTGPGRSGAIGPSVRSFDVYDTLITRATGSGRTVFYSLGARLHREGVFPGTPEEFAEARIAAAQSAFRASGTTLRLTDVYEELARFDTWGEIDWTRVLKEELEEESRLSRPVPAGVEAVKSARASGHGIAFVSDMYVPTEFLRHELTRHGVAKEDDLVLVSGDAGKSKYDGHLFDTLLETTGAQAAEVIHRGDCHHADGKQAAARGILTEIAVDARLNRYEKLLDDADATTGGLGGLMAGSSRLARLTTLARAEDTPVRDVSAGVAAPVLVSFVLWLFNTAKDRGRNRIYFVSRDGEILLHIARRLQPLMAPDLDLRYLYSSRKAWFFDPGLDADVPATPDGRRNLRDFLVQEGLADGTPSIVVDVGWFGRAFQGMAQGVIDAGASPPLCLFIGLNLQVDPLFEKATWWFDGYEDDAPYAMHGVVQLLESWCAGLEGTLDHYDRVGEKVLPILSGDTNDAVIAWGLPLVRETVDRFLDAFLDGWAHVRDPAACMSGVSIQLVRLFWATPSSREALRWGTFPVETNEHDAVVTLARPLDLRSAIEMGWKRSSYSHDTYWRAATLKTTARPVRAVMKATRMLRKVLPI